MIDTPNTLSTPGTTRTRVPIRPTLRSPFLAVLIAILAATAGTALAQGQGAATPAPAGASVSPAVVPAIPDTSAEQTREELERLLDRYPPGLGRVLKLDPGLLANDTYMAAYPALRAFVAQHPEVLRSSGYYLHGIYLPAERGPEAATVDLWQNMIDYFGAFLVFAVVTTVLVWLVKMILEQRRWSRLSKIQTEVHGKLLERFSSNQDLLAYMQTSPGKRFLEAAPFPVDLAPSRGVGAPVNRILWSVQAGLVLSALGAGLVIVSSSVLPMIAQPLFVLGIVALSIGVGFILSAVVSYVISRRMGLLTNPSSPFDREQADSTRA